MKIYDEIDSRLRSFIERQRVFFVGTSPLDQAGHVNVSPKGLDALRVLGPRSLAYLDHVGSGAETIAHLRENGRIVVMLCAFDGPPKILRLHGRGDVLEPQDADYPSLRALFPDLPQGRAIIRVAVDRIADSCGFGVPLYTYQKPRPHLMDWVAKQGEEGLAEYQKSQNRVSIDDLPALRWTV